MTKPIIVVPPDATVAERVAIGRVLEKDERLAAVERIRESNRNRATKGPYVRSAGSAALAIVGRKVGLGGITKYSHATAVISAAEADPKTFGDLVEKMDEYSVNWSFREMKRRQNGSGRHPMHSKTHYPKADKALNSAINTIGGIVVGLEIMTDEMISGLDRDQSIEIGRQFMAFARKLSKLGRRLRHVQER